MTAMDNNITYEQCEARTERCRTELTDMIDKIEKDMKESFNRVHERIDSLHNKFTQLYILMITLLGTAVFTLFKEFFKEVGK